MKSMNSKTGPSSLYKGESTEHTSVAMSRLAMERLYPEKAKAYREVMEQLREKLK